MEKFIKSFSQFKEMVENDTDLQDQIKADPKNAIRQFKSQDPIYTKDKWVYRLVVGILGSVILISVIGVVTLMSGKTDNVDKLIPTMLTALSSAAIGALTGLLAPSPRASNT